MIKIYFKQAWQLIRESKLLSTLSIVGTALAISIIMVIIIILHAKTADYEPEVNRSRMLYVKWGSAVRKENSNHRNYNRLGLRDIREAFYPLEIPEAVSAIHPYGGALLSLPGGTEEVSCDFMIYTDAAFWRVNEFRFLAGKPYDQASFEAGIKQAVLCESIARSLYGGVQEAIGQRIKVNYVEYTVCGVVRDVSKFAEWTYAEVWLPYTTNSEITQLYISEWGEGHSGNFSCQILARSSADFPAIREELKQSIAKMNANSKEAELDIMDQPDDFIHQMLHVFANEFRFSEIVLRYLIIILVVLMVPAVNLSGMSQSRLYKRVGEMGVRKAFGATRFELIRQVLIENFILTLIGGVFGLVFSYLCIGLMSNWLLATDGGGVAAMHPSMISPWIFLIALLFCLVLNLLSAGIPAWRVARASIVNSLNEN